VRKETSPQRPRSLTRSPFAPSITTLEAELGTLPAADRDALREHVEVLDFDRFREAVRALEILSPACREHLRLAADRFDHDHLHALLRANPAQPT
jgi:hypothetical protein